MSTQAQYSVSVVVDNVDLGVWDKKSGGQVDSGETKYRPGGMSAEISLGGSQTVENVTVQRLYKLDRDHVRLPFLNSRAGKGAVTVTVQPLDVDGFAFGKPIVYKGKLKRVTPPEIDSESDDAGMIELEISTSGSVV